MSWYRVYVVELDSAAHTALTGTKGAVYVGETALTREQRFAKHKEGGRTAVKIVTNHGLRLAPELYGHIKAFRTRDEAVAAEKRLREELIADGWQVYGGTRGMNEAFRDD